MRECTADHDAVVGKLQDGLDVGIDHGQKCVIHVTCRAIGRANPGQACRWRGNRPLVASYGDGSEPAAHQQLAILLHRQGQYWIVRVDTVRGIQAAVGIESCKIVSFRTTDMVELAAHDDLAV